MLVALADTPTPIPSPQGGGGTRAAPMPITIVVASANLFTCPPGGTLRVANKAPTEFPSP
jgi:hypothetical protein